MKQPTSGFARVTLTAALLAASTAWTGIALAQEYPAKPITIVVPFPVGSAIDNLLRPISLELQKSLGQPVIIDNKPGAQGVLGSQSVAQAQPDGYTLLAGSSTTLAANVTLFKNLSYDPIKDFTPIANLGYVSLMYLVRADSPASDLKAYVDQARKAGAPSAAAYGSSSAQIALAMLSTAAKVDFTPVPYKGTPQAITDLIGGTVPMAVVDIGNGMPHIKSGRARALATTAPERSAATPDIPVLAETYPGAQLVTWIGLVAPAGTPAPVVDKIHAALAPILSGADMKEKFASVSTEVDLLGPAQFAERLRVDQERWAKLIRASGIEPQ